MSRRLATLYRQYFVANCSGSIYFSIATDTGYQRGWILDKKERFNYMIQHPVSSIQHLSNTGIGCVAARQWSHLSSIDLQDA